MIHSSQFQLDVLELAYARSGNKMLIRLHQLAHHYAPNLSIASVFGKEMPARPSARTIVPFWLQIESEFSSHTHVSFESANFQVVYDTSVEPR